MRREVWRDGCGGGALTRYVCMSSFMCLSNACLCVCIYVCMYLCMYVCIDVFWALDDRYWPPDSDDRNQVVQNEHSIVDVAHLTRSETQLALIDAPLA